MACWIQISSPWRLIVAIGTSCLLLTGTIKPNFSCIIVNIYCPNELSKRKKLWETIISIGNECIGGDFNEIRNIGERKGMAGRTGA